MGHIMPTAPCQRKRPETFRFNRREVLTLGVAWCCLMLSAVLSFNPMETDDPQTPRDPERVIGREMRRIRERLGLTQQEVAERMLKNGFRFHQTQIAKMERGERPIRVNEWIAIATALGTTPQDMLSSAISASVSQSTEKRLSLLELAREMGAIEQRLQAAQRMLDKAEERATKARLARDVAEASWRDAEMGLTEARTQVHELATARDHLEKRIWDARRQERRTREESALDSILDEAEQSIAALDGMTDALDSDGRSEGISPFAKLGRNLEKGRLAKGISQDDLAAASGVPVSDIHRIEQGDFSTLGDDARARAVLRMLAAFLNLDPMTMGHRYEMARNIQLASKQPPSSSTKADED